MGLGGGRRGWEGAPLPAIVLTAVQHGATALNYVKAESPLKDAMGKVVGVVAQEQLDPGSKV